MNPNDFSLLAAQMSAENASAAALALAADHNVMINKVISVRYLSTEQRLTFEQAEGGVWIVLLEERSPYGERYGTEECMVMVEDKTGKASFEMTL